MVKVTDGSGGGAWFRPQNGMYVMEFTGARETVGRDYDTGEPKDTWQFSFAIGSFPAFELLKDEAGEAVTYREEVTRSLHPKSRAYAIISALLDREIKTGEDSDDLFEEAAGRKMLAQFAKSTTGKDGRLTQQMPFKPVN